MEVSIDQFVAVLITASLVLSLIMVFMQLKSSGVAANDFYANVAKFNKMYKLPCPSAPHPPTNQEIQIFKSIIMEEVHEADDILQIVDPLDRSVAMADWLGDLIIYCHTMAARIGLPTKEILDIIMQSNFSKLGADGEPIYDERGKVEKGPGYWKPEPSIKKLLVGNGKGSV